MLLQRDAFDQIKKLEKLVLDLRLEMKEQQKSFNDQLVDIYTAKVLFNLYYTYRHFGDSIVCTKRRSNGFT